MSTLGIQSPPQATSRQRPSLPFWEQQRARPGWPKLLALAGLFLIGLGASTWGLRRFLEPIAEIRFDESIWGREQLPLYLQNRGQLDGIFIGSSRVARGVVPGIFDAEMARAGFAVRSMNLARADLQLVESSSLVDLILERQPSGLAWVMIELNEFDPLYFEANRRGKRTVGWHTPSATRDILAFIWDSERSWGLKLAESYEHLLEAGAHHLSLGLARSVVQLLVRGTSAPPDSELTRAAGYMRWDEELVASASEFEGTKRRLPLRPGRSAGLPGVQQRFVERLVSKLRAAGIQPVFVLMPAFMRSCGSMQLAQQGSLPWLIDFQARDQFPELYQNHNFRDRQHLNNQGAELFSRELALQMARLYAQGLVPVKRDLSK